MTSVDVPIMKKVIRDKDMSSREWKVYYSGNFWGHEKGERRCREIVVEKTFTWAGQNWRIPSIYACPRGLVVDFCAEVPAEEIKAFLEKWNLWGTKTEEEAVRTYTEEETMRLDAENPLSFRMMPDAYVNGRQLQGDHGCSVSWNPYPPDGTAREPETKEVLEHYQCNPMQGWIFIRYAFYWSDKTESRRMRTPVIRELTLRLKADAAQVAGPHFCTILKAAGETAGNSMAETAGNSMAESAGNSMAESEEFDFVHPVTGKPYKLQVTALERGELPGEAFFVHDDMDSKHRTQIEENEWPRRFVQMEYAITPDLSGEEFYLTDCARCDQPRRKVQENESMEPQSTVAVAVAAIGGADKSAESEAAESESAETSAATIIGGADGPTSIFVSGKGKPKTHLACSAPHFEWVDMVEWRMVFHKQVREIKEVVIDRFS